MYPNFDGLWYMLTGAEGLQEERAKAIYNGHEKVDPAMVSCTET